MYDVNENSELIEIRNREIVEEFLSKKKELSDEERNRWNIHMLAYYKQRKNS